LHPGKETTVFALGNPIRPPEPGDRAAACKALGVDPARRTLLIFGGSQGARALNYGLAAALEHGLLADVNVIWGTAPRTSRAAACWHSRAAWWCTASSTRSRRHIAPRISSCAAPAR